MAANCDVILDMDFNRYSGSSYQSADRDKLRDEVDISGGSRRSSNGDESYTPGLFGSQWARAKLGESMLRVEQPKGIQSKHITLNNSLCLCRCLCTCPLLSRSSLAAGLES